MNIVLKTSRAMIGLNLSAQRDDLRRIFNNFGRVWQPGVSQKVGWIRAEKNDLISHPNPSRTELLSLPLAKLDMALYSFSEAMVI